MAADIARLAVARVTEPPEPPQPLYRALPPAEPFPVEALGPVLADAARAVQDRIQAPLAICAQSVLATAALAVQGFADVELPTGQTRPVSLFLLTVAASGERKSSADQEALWPVNRRETALRGEFARETLDYENSKTAWDKARDEEIKRAKGNRALIKAALDALGPPPPVPPRPMLICSEPTIEGLGKALADASPSMGVFSAEGGRFIGGHGMTDEAKLRSAAGLSELWDGVPLRRVRAGEIIVQAGRRLSLHLLAQPGVARGFLGDPLLQDQGLLSRILVSAPDPAAGTRFFHPAKPESDRALRRYGARLLEIFETPPNFAGPGELAPRTLELEPGAKALWVHFYDHLEHQLMPGGDLEPVKPLVNKLPEHAARIAGVLALVEDLDCIAITADQMEAGIELAEHYLSEALRLQGSAGLSGDLMLGQTLLNWLNGWPEPAISLAAIYQLGPGGIRVASVARKAVTVLEDHGHLERIPEGATVAGVMRREAWRIVRGA